MAAPSAVDGTALMHLPTVMTLLREMTLKMQDTEQENKELKREVRGLMPVVERERLISLAARALAQQQCCPNECEGTVKMRRGKQRANYCGFECVHRPCTSLGWSIELGCQ